jgi:hypothetical protein
MLVNSSIRLLVEEVNGHIEQLNKFRKLENSEPKAE